MKRAITGACVALALSGCVSLPTPQSRSEWNEVHSRTYSGKSVEQVLDSAEKVLRAADKDFTFDYPDGKLVASRRWSMYMVLAAAAGTDYWDITTSPVPEGTKVTVQVNRASGAMYASPVVGGAGGATVASSNLPGQPLQWRPVYDLFWNRMDYMLKDGTWVSCTDFKKGKPQAQKAGLDALCSMTTDDGPAPTVS